MKKNNVETISTEFSNYFINDFAILPLSELVNKCSTLLPTNVADSFIGITFVEREGGPQLEVSVVKETFAGKRRVPLDHVKTEYQVLQVYGLAGEIVSQFMQRLIDWGQLTQALEELLPKEAI